MPVVLGETLLFHSIRECAEFCGVAYVTVYKALTQSYRVRGMSLRLATNQEVERVYADPFFYALR